MAYHRPFPYNVTKDIDSNWTTRVNSNGEYLQNKQNIYNYGDYNNSNTDQKTWKARCDLLTQETSAILGMINVDHNYVHPDSVKGFSSIRELERSIKSKRSREELEQKNDENTDIKKMKFATEVYNVENVLIKLKHFAQEIESDMLKRDNFNLRIKNKQSETTREGKIQQLTTEIINDSTFDALLYPTVYSKMLYKTVFRRASPQYLGCVLSENPVLLLFRSMTETLITHFTMCDIETFLVENSEAICNMKSSMKDMCTNPHSVACFTEKTFIQTIKNMVQDLCQQMAEIMSISSNYQLYVMWYTVCGYVPYAIGDVPDKCDCPCMEFHHTHIDNGNFTNRIEAMLTKKLFHMLHDFCTCKSNKIVRILDPSECVIFRNIHNELKVKSIMNMTDNNQYEVKIINKLVLSDPSQSICGRILDEQVLENYSIDIIKSMWETSMVPQVIIGKKAKKVPDDEKMATMKLDFDRQKREMDKKISDSSTTNEKLHGMLTNVQDAKKALDMKYENIQELMKTFNTIFEADSKLGHEVTKLVTSMTLAGITQDTDTYNDALTKLRSSLDQTDYYKDITKQIAQNKIPSLLHGTPVDITTKDRAPLKKYMGHMADAISENSHVEATSSRSEDPTISTKIMDARLAMKMQEEYTTHKGLLRQEQVLCKQQNSYLSTRLMALSNMLQHAYTVISMLERTQAMSTSNLYEKSKEIDQLRDQKELMTNVLNKHMSFLYDMYDDLDLNESEDSSSSNPDDSSDTENDIKKDSMTSNRYLAHIKKKVGKMLKKTNQLIKKHGESIKESQTKGKGTFNHTDIFDTHNMKRYENLKMKPNLTNMQANVYHMGSYQEDFDEIIGYKLSRDMPDIQKISHNKEEAWYSWCVHGLKYLPLYTHAKACIRLTPTQWTNNLIFADFFHICYPQKRIDTSILDEEKNLNPLTMDYTQIVTTLFHMYDAGRFLKCFIDWTASTISDPPKSMKAPEDHKVNKYIDDASLNPNDYRM